MRRKKYIEANKVKKAKNNNTKKQHYLITQDNIQMFDKIIFFTYRTRQIKATETNKKLLNWNSSLTKIT